MSYVARLKPLDPRKGQVAESYAHSGFNLRWNQGTVHRGLSESQAAQLRPLRQRKGSAPLFDVVPEAEWDDFLAAEAAARLGLPRPAKKAPESSDAPAPTAEVAPITPGADAPVPPVLAPPVEQTEHVDVAGQRVQLTQPAPAETPAAEPAKATTRGPRKPGGQK